MASCKARGLAQGLESRAMPASSLVMMIYVNDMIPPDFAYLGESSWRSRRGPRRGFSRVSCSLPCQRSRDQTHGWQPSVYEVNPTLTWPELLFRGVPCAWDGHPPGQGRFSCKLALGQGILCWREPMGVVKGAGRSYLAHATADGSWQLRGGRRYLRKPAFPSGDSVTGCKQVEWWRQRDMLRAKGEQDSAVRSGPNTEGNPGAGPGAPGISNTVTPAWAPGAGAESPPRRGPRHPLPNGRQGVGSRTGKASNIGIP